MTILVGGIDKTFVGMGEEDCIDKFIDWLISENFVWTSQDINVQFTKHNREGTRPPRLFNYIIAHNGFQFDYRFFYEKLIKIGSEFKMIGDIN